ncbi:elongin-A-like [Myotis myotis]|uniref:elongin-A-like n=1 Tax=Myotis myotis TaxID=51298 RepID=UPI00174C7C76|nr:elongin-A-like [Myotis myotis]
MEGDPRASRGRSHSSERPRSKHRAPSPLPRPLPGPRFGDLSEERRPGHPEPPGGRGPSPPRGAGAPWMPAVQQRAPALAPEAARRPAEGRLAASPDRPLGAPQGRGEHPPLGAQGQEQPSAGSTQRPRPASAREQSPRPLCPEGTAGRLASRGAQKGKERGGRSSQRPKPPSEVASHNPEKKRKRRPSGETQSHKCERRPHGCDAGEGPGGPPRKVREKVGDTTQTPAGKVGTPPLGRKPGGPRPEMEEELDPPAASFEASFTHHQPPSQEASEHPLKRRTHKHSRKSPSDKDKQRRHGSDAGSGAGVLPPKVREKVGDTLKTPEGKVKTPHLGRKPAVPRLEEEEEFQPPTMSFQAGVTYDPRPSQGASDHPTLPWLAGAPGMSGAPSEVASENPMKKRKRKHSSQSQSHKDQQRLQGLDAGEGPGGLLPKAFSGSNRARRRKMITMLQQCVQTLQNKVTLLSQERGVPCSLLQPAVESCTPEQLPRLGEHHGAPAAETDPLGKKHCALEKERREEHTSQLQPQEQEAPELGLHISANRPQDPPANMAFSDPSERGGGAAVQEKALPAPAPTAGTRAPSHPASGHSCRPIPGKQVVSSHKKPVKKIAPLMAKSIKDYKIRCYQR